MLTLTPKATELICQIAEQSGLPDKGGIRIARTDNGTEPVTIGPAGGPEAGDETVEEGGARVFLEHGAASMLTDKVLDAGVTPEGGVAFMVSPQGGTL